MRPFYNPMKKRYYTEAELAVIYDMSLTVAEVAKRTGRSRQGIKTKRSEKNGPKGGTYSFVVPSKPKGMTREQIEWALENRHTDKQAGLILLFAAKRPVFE